MKKNPWSKASQKASARKRRGAASSEPAPDLLVLPAGSSGRMTAWAALQQFDETGKFVADSISDADRDQPLSAQERGLAVDIASGTLRRRRTLDAILESLLTRPRSKVEADLWRLLQIGAYQILFSRTPEHAAIDTTVELARVAGRERWCGFANGILRSVQRLLTENTTEQPGPASVPLADGQYRVLAQPVFADPLTDLADYVGDAFSLPRVIARRWASRFTAAELLRMCFHAVAIPDTVLRVNRLKVSVQRVQAALQDHGVEVAPGINDWSLNIGHVSRLQSLPGYADGWWSVQDEAAMSAAEALKPQPGERILDLCAAPGGKTTHLAEISGDQATIVACDVSGQRLNRVHENVARLNLNSVQIHVIGDDGRDVPPGPYDAVLVDVPCSNTGVFSRRPEARWRFREDDLDELVQLQTRLLVTAFEQTRPGGRILYSTCSIEPEETTLLIKNLPRLIPGLTLITQHLTLPTTTTDGAFHALLQKT
ncbi:MAG: transcription antitermination factor NusB [Planctomycetaceae bacterium]